MNYPEFESFLMQNTDYVFVERTRKANTILDLYNIEYLEEIADIIFRNSDNDNTAILDNINATFISIFNNICNIHGIYIKEDTNLSVLIELCSGIKYLESYIDKTAISNIVEMDTTVEERVCQLLTLVTDMNIEELMTYIESVDDNFILMFSNNTINDNVDKDISNNIDKYGKYKKFINNKELFSDNYISNTETIGLPYLMYIDNYVNHVKKIAELDANTISHDLVGLAILSSDKEPPVVLCRKYMDKITSNVNLSTNIDSRIINITTKLG